MDREGFSTHAGSSDMNSAGRSHSIHIPIEDRTIHNHSIPNVQVPSPVSRETSGLHSMLHRVRQHTFGNNFGHPEWRMNFNHLRNLISSNENFRSNYQRLSTRRLSNETPNPPENHERMYGRNLDNEILRRLRALERVRPDRARIHETFPESHALQPAFEAGTANREHGSNPNQSAEATQSRPPSSHARLDDENNNEFSSMFIPFLPFVAILVVKFVHDHVSGIIDIAFIQFVVYTVNKSLCNQVSKLSEKKIRILLRDISLIVAVATFRYLITTAPPDPFGLILTPPTESMTIEISTPKQLARTANSDDSIVRTLTKFLNSNKQESTELDAGNTITITKGISLSLLIYYVTVNDLFLKMLTILTKILLTLVPNNLLRYKQRARMYAVIEYFSQLYRALVPTRQWVMFLFRSYTGMEVISGVLFSAFYMGAKSFELVSRAKMLYKAFMSFVRNMDYERKPTGHEIETAGPICPICHDAYKTPIILTCNHVFCDDCVTQWFKREQTCPMCRARVSEDPRRQDGSTTFFYQLC